MRRTISIILFPGFELLDVFGPVELFAFVEDYSLEFLSSDGAPVKSSQGVEIIATGSFMNLQENPDILMVPGGQGTRTLCKNIEFLMWLRDAGRESQIIMSVCTGAALLAAAGLLDGYRATTNKRAYKWVTSHSSQVNWIRHARWIQDGNRWSSSGIAAGIYMAAAFIRHEYGEKFLASITQRMEIEVSKDHSYDPFA